MQLVQSEITHVILRWNWTKQCADAWSLRCVYKPFILLQLFKRSENGSSMPKHSRTLKSRWVRIRTWVYNSNTAAGSPGEPGRQILSGDVESDCSCSIGRYERFTIGTVGSWRIVCRLQGSQQSIKNFNDYDGGTVYRMPSYWVSSAFVVITPKLLHTQYDGSQHMYSIWPLHVLSNINFTVSRPDTGTEVTYQKQKFNIRYVVVFFLQKPCRYFRT